jgi:hypothetical protein
MKQTDRDGVNAVEGIFIRELKWIFREQAISDWGIDAHVEVTNRDEPSGRLLALQSSAAGAGMPELKYYDAYSTDNPPWIKALAEVRRLAPREGWCYCEDPEEFGICVPGPISITAVGGVPNLERAKKETLSFFA